ncbi:MAG: hypothetical protein ACYC9O_05120 [Candidatus Latescibacterota bacterium]
MSSRVKFLPVFLAVLFLAAVMAGCNIFGFTSDKEQTPLEKAEDAIRSGDYAPAKKELTDENGALKDSTDSMALYTYSKAVLLESGLNVMELVDLVQEKDGTNPSSNNLALLDKIDGKDYVTQTKWYRANTEIALKLARIWNSRTTGDLTKDDIALDYTVSNVMSGVLSLRDTNRDTMIDGKDFQINISDVGKLLGGGVEGYGFTGITARDEKGNTVQFEGLTAFLGGSAPSLKTAKAAAGVAGYTPDMINPFIATFFQFLAGGEESIGYLIENLAESTSYDPQEIREYIDKAAKIINFYWYDDGVDNDGDGRTDEEVIDGKDNDSDGLTDEDSKYMAAYDTSNTRNTQYIPVWQQWRTR